MTFLEAIKLLIGNYSFSERFMFSGFFAHIVVIIFLILLIIGIKLVFKSKSRKKFWIYSIFIPLPFLFGVFGSFFGLAKTIQSIPYILSENIDKIKIENINLMYIYGIRNSLGPIYIGGLETLVLIILFLISLNKQEKKMENIILERTNELSNANKEMEEQSILIIEKNTKLTDSIEYASLIQNSILPRNEEISQYIKDFFIIWKPKDIVGGDFYWFFPIPNSQNYIISEIDCTGHGVPGAFMSMTANSILNNIVREKKIYEPDKILNLLHKEIRYTLRQQSREAQQDGMDISICYIDVNFQEIHFSGAMQHLYFIKKGDRRKEIGKREIERIRGNRFSIGGKQKEEERIFTKHTIRYDSGNIIYLLSDGLADQKVRIDGKETRLKIKRVKEMLLKYCSLPMAEQKKKIEEELAELQGEIEQRDDIVMVGVKL
ncbi:MAG: SpoIIE family protein phosphatase [Candidatus Cloacimonetes bacterium]|nr:SpoIIE family protein phosphatase [Candidatus Cloacimonadota bacterium]